MFVIKFESSLLVIYTSQLQQYYKVVPEAATPPPHEAQHSTTKRPNARDILGLRHIRPITAQRSLEIEVETYLNDNSITTDSLSFWQVCCSNQARSASPSLPFNRKTKAVTPPFLLSQWTSYLFRRPLSLVKGCFHQPRLPCHRGGIGSPQILWRHFRFSSFWFEMEGP